MPTLTYDKKDLLKIVGKKISDEQLEEVINLIKPSVEKVSGDEITVEHTPDRPDLFGIEGLARAIQDYLNIDPGLQKYVTYKPQLSVKVEPVPVRPFIAAAAVRNVKMTDELIKSLMNIQEVLHETIGRKRLKVAVGIHDLDKIKGPISYVGASRESKIIPLDFKEEMTLKEVLNRVPKGKDYGHIISSGKLWPVYEDAMGIFSFPPIINSDRTRLTPNTKNLFIELSGVDKKSVLQTLNIIVTNLAERKFKVEQVRLQYEKRTEVTPDLNETVVEIDKDGTNKLLGITLDGKEIVELLRRMGYDGIETKKGKIEVIVPAYRSDILHPVDVMEDVAIAYGFNNFNPKLPDVATVGKPLPLEKLCGKVRQIAVGLGMTEVSRFVLSNPKDQFDKMNVPREEVVEIENPLSEEHTCLRAWLLPSLMKVLSVNKQVEYPQNIFEIGDVVWADENEEVKSKTVRKVCGVVCHSKVGFAEIKGIADVLLKSFGVNYSLEECPHRGYMEGRGAHILVNKKVVGSFGEVNPQTLQNWGMEMPVASFEINLEII